VFATNDPSKGLLRVSASGGETEKLTTLDPGQEMVAQHLFPSVLPGGAAVLFTIGDFTGGEATAQIAVLDLKTRQRKVLIRGGSQAQYVETGHLLYRARTALWAVRFDPVKLDVRGDPALVVDQVMTTATGAANFSVASTHVLEAPHTTGLWGAQTGVSGIDEASRLVAGAGRPSSHLLRNHERRPVLARQHLVRVVVVPGQCRDRIDFQNAVEPSAGERVVREG